MKERNIRSLENMSLFCHLCGLVSVFLGFIVVFLELGNRGIAFIQAGLFIVATGYTYVKISERIARIILDEKK